MKQKIAKRLFAACLAAGLTVGALSTARLGIKAAADDHVDIQQVVDTGLTIRESEVNQLLAGDLKLPKTVVGLTDASISYSVNGADADYVSVQEGKDGAYLKITRPRAGKGNYKFTLTASVTADGKTAQKEFPLTIWQGLSEDDYAGYLYVCFSVAEGAGPSNDRDVDVQQLHFFLSEDGLNWTALNGCQPLFLTGSDYADKIVKSGANSINYEVAEGTDISKTVSGDASVLFPFEGNDQGVRDPYIIRGSKKDGSDSEKAWILATDLNTHSSKYGGDRGANKIGSWGQTTEFGKGSTNLFIYETDDWVHWTRRYIDVGNDEDGNPIGMGMAWAPEAIYNPDKDNYLVYWSSRVTTDDRTRDRLYCCETKDFVTFGPTKLYEEEPFYKNHNKGNDGYGNIDTSQLWVAGTDEDGKETPYGTLYRVVKDESNNHIELMSADTVLDPEKDYDKTSPVRITPYTLDGKTYSTLEDLNSLENDTNGLKRAEIVYNWFINESVGNHFTKIPQKGIEKFTGAYEGATMFKFIDRDEWCVMIDFYGSMRVRYEPYTTTDLSKPDSIEKMSGGYGRTGGDIGTHGGMIPITVKEYNTLIDTYNDKSNMTEAALENYHEIPYISVDEEGLKENLKEKADELAALTADNTKKSLYSDGVWAQIGKLAAQMTEMSGNDVISVSTVSRMISRADALVANTLLEIPVVEAEDVALSVYSVSLSVGGSKELKAEVSPESAADKTITWSSDSDAVTVANGKVTAVKAGTAKITAETKNGKKAVCTVTVK